MVDVCHSNILVTGAHGFVGRALCEALAKRGAERVLAPTSRELDLMDGRAVRAALQEHRPDLVFHLAARVGGIGANQKNPASFFYENAMMGIQLLHEAHAANVRKLVAVATVCGYPKHAPTPFREDDLWNGYPEETNAPYGIAKKLLSVQSLAYRAQYGFDSVVVYPTNLYGPHDNFDLEASHVIPAMFQKLHRAAQEGDPHVVLWGDGSPTREFLYVADCADALILAAERYDSSEPLNIGSGQEISIRELASRLAKLVGYRGEIVWDPSMPNGQARRSIDVSRAEKELGFVARTTLADGLGRTYQWFKDQLAEPHGRTDST